jgi:hypothetical protein
VAARPGFCASRSFFGAVDERGHLLSSIHPSQLLLLQVRDVLGSLDYVYKGGRRSKVTHPSLCVLQNRLRSFSGRVAIWRPIRRVADES